MADDAPSTPICEDETPKHDSDWHRKGDEAEAHSPSAEGEGAGSPREGEDDTGFSSTKPSSLSPSASKRHGRSMRDLGAGVKRGLHGLGERMKLGEARSRIRGLPKKFLKESWRDLGPQEQMLAVAKLHVELDKEGLLKPEHDSYTLHRFLRARKFNIPEAKAMFIGVLQWRKENGVDTILEDFNFEEQEEYAAIYKQGYHRTDKMGRPVYIECLRGVTYEQLISVTTEERVIKKQIQEYEKLMKIRFPACSRATGRHIDQGFNILDVGGVRLGDFNKNLRNILKKLMAVASDNYPETMGKMMIINAPRIFTMIWAVVKTMLDARTASKIEVHGGGYLPKLLQYVDAENLPVQFGGLDNTPWPEGDPGPWELLDHLPPLADDDHEETVEPPSELNTAREGGSPRDVEEGEGGGGGEEAGTLASRIALLEQEYRNKGATLLAPTRKGALSAYEPTAPAHSLLGRVEILEHAMLELQVEGGGGGRGGGEAVSEKEVVVE